MPAVRPCTMCKLSRNGSKPVGPAEMPLATLVLLLLNSARIFGSDSDGMTVPCCVVCASVSYVIRHLISDLKTPPPCELFSQLCLVT